MYSKNNPRKSRKCFSREESDDFDPLATSRICPLPILPILMHLYHHPRARIKSENLRRDLNSMRSSKKQTISDAPVGSWAGSSSRGRFTSCESEKARHWVRYRRLSDVFMNIGKSERASEPFGLARTKASSNISRPRFVLRQVPDTISFWIHSAKLLAVCFMELTNCRALEYIAFRLSCLGMLLSRKKMS